MLIHTAKDLGQPGPDYIYGYGAVDAKALIDTLREGSVNIATRAKWRTPTIADSATHNWRFEVAPGTAELKASLAWDDPAAAAFAANAPVNDLTLQLIGPGGITFDAFVLDPANPQNEATTVANPRDNQEQVIVANPVPGRWGVRVKGTSVPSGPQQYGLVYTSKAATYDPATCATASAGFESGDDLFVLGGASRVPAPAGGHGAFSLQLGGAVSTLHEAYREIAVPDLATRAALTYHVYSATLESLVTGGYGGDFLTVEVRDSAGNVQAVIDSRNDGWKTGVWLRQFEVDLTPWSGKTIKIAFRVSNDAEEATTFWVDDVNVDICTPPA